jgi:hypothetical protein
MCLAKGQKYVVSAHVSVVDLYPAALLSVHWLSFRSWFITLNLGDEQSFQLKLFPTLANAEAQESYYPCQTRWVKVAIKWIGRDQ